jgi:NAD(P)-dependent dehydrogenase (short-subunit alcohol dehydrogenase family)
MSPSAPSRRVAIVCQADSYIGPDLARVLAARGHDLVLARASAGLAEELDALGAASVTVDVAAHDLTAGPRLAAAAVERFGTFHSAFFSSGRIAVGRFTSTTIDDLRAAVAGNIEAPYAFVQGVLPTLLGQRDGQILVATSATAGAPTPKASLYAGTRAGATMMLRSLGLEVADSGVQVNVVGSNFMDFPEFLRGNRAETPEGRARVEALVPMRRLGSTVEMANFCAALLDGSSRFQTGQFFTYAGGWG